jgi:hypothetical protein
MSLDADLTATVTDDAVEFTLAVENTGDDDVELQFSDGQRVEVVVTEDGAQRWRASEGMMYTMALGTERFPPGERREFGVEWADPEPGDYEAKASLVATDGDAAATTTFSV